MEAHAVSSLFLAIPAACILALLLEYLRRNHGTGVAVAFVLTCGAYGLVRGAWVLSISQSHGVPMPYRMAGSVRIGTASPMELVGWMLAAALAWQAGAHLVRLFGDRAGRESVYRTAFAGALVMAALSLAVETAAIAGGWWDWSIPPPPDTFLKVPVIGIVDWAFVAFDFLLPFLVFSRRSSLLDRALSLCMFPVHFASHLYLKAPFPSVPLSFFELAHFGIPLWIFWRAVGEAPSTDRVKKPEWGWIVPGSAAILVAADTALTTFLARRESSAVFVLPLAVVGLLTFLSGRRRNVKAAPVPAGPRVRLALRICAVVVASSLLFFVRLPANQRRDTYARSFVEGVAKFNAGDTIAAERLLREAVNARPDKAEPHLILAMTLGRLGRADESARELAEAIRIKPALSETPEAKVLRDALAEMQR